MNKKQLTTAQLAFFPSIEKYKANQSQVNDDTLIFIEDTNYNKTWKQAFKASDSTGHYDINKPICTLPKGWTMCYIYYNWRGNIQSDSFNGAYLIPIHNDTVFFIDTEIGLQAKPNGEIYMTHRGQASDATVHAVYYI